MKDKIFKLKFISFILFSLFSCIGIFCILTWKGYVFNIFGKTSQIIDLILGIFFIILSIIFAFIYYKSYYDTYKATKLKIKFKKINNYINNEYFQSNLVKRKNYKKTIYKSKKRRFTTLILYECDNVSEELKLDMEFEKDSFYSTNFNNIILSYYLFIIVVPLNFNSSMVDIITFSAPDVRRIGGIRSSFIPFVYNKSEEELIPFTLKYFNINEINSYQRVIKKFYKYIDKE